MDPKVKTFLTNIGVTFDLETVEETKINELSTNYLAERQTIALNSEAAKEAIKNARSEGKIIVAKEIKAKFNTSLGLGLTSKEAETMETEEFLTLAKTKNEETINILKAKAPEEYKAKIEDLTKKQNDLILALDSTKTDYEKKLEEANNKFINAENQRVRNTIVSESLKAKSYVSEKGAYALFNSEIATKNIVINADKTIKNQDGGVVLAADGVTPLRTVDDLRDNILKDEFKNPGAPPAGGAQVSTEGLTAEQIAAQQQAIRHFEEMNPSMKL